jgi:hypothetical protein
MHVMHASMRGSVHIVSREAGRLFNILGSQHVCTIVRISAECVAPGRLQSGDTKNGMSFALVGFLATCPEIQPRSTG